jgi:hypothetical protein
MEERGNGKGKLAEAFEEGQGLRRAVEPMTTTMMMMMMIIIIIIIILFLDLWFILMLH